jgi:hypothetical protein
MNSRIAFVLALILASPAYAGDSTVTSAAGTGGPTFHTKTDGSSNNFGFVAIGDGVAGANSATVKPASTASVAGDSPLVVAFHPSSPVPAGANLIGKFGIDQTTAGTTNAISIAQVAATGISTGAGATGAGTLRVGVAQDTTTIAGSAPGTAGSASAQVISVQGVASMTPLLSNPGTPANWGVGATGSSVPANGVLGMMSNSGTSVALQGDSTNGLWVNIKAGAGSGGTAQADNAAWTAGTTQQTPAGCEYTSGGATALTTGHVGTLGCTSARGIFTDKSSVAGTALVAAVSAYGTAPTGTEVEGVNAYVTNTNANGPAAASAASPVTPSNQPVGAAAFATAQVSCGSTATSLVSARTGVSGTGRVSVTATNTTTTAVYIGASGVTTSTGALLPGIVGASLTLNTTAQLYCIVATGSATVSEIETY